MKIEAVRHPQHSGNPKIRNNTTWNFNNKLRRRGIANVVNEQKEQNGDYRFCTKTKKMEKQFTKSISKQIILYPVQRPVIDHVDDWNKTNIYLLSGHRPWYSYILPFDVR